MKPKKFFLAVTALICFILTNSFLFGESEDLFNEEFLKVFSYRELGPARQGGRILRDARMRVPLCRSDLRRYAATIGPKATSVP